MNERPPMDITEEIVGDVAILRVRGRLTIGDPSEQFHDYLKRSLSAGQKKILVDLAEVPQIDSSGVSALVRASIHLARQGGSLMLSVEPGRVRDALTVSRLVEAIPTFSSVEEALVAFATAPFYCFCPICGSRSEPPSGKQKVLHWGPQTCSRCDSQFSVTSEMPVNDGTVLERIKIFTYGKEGEYVEILPGPPVAVAVVGRLDLFSSRTLVRSFQAIPAPRTVAIDLGRTTEISDGGRDALLALLAGITRGDKIVVSLEGIGPDVLATLSNLSKAFHLTKNAALAALGPVSKKSAWLVRVGRS